MANKHLIGKQILKLEIDSSKNAYAIQQHMSQMVWKDLLPELNKLFDKIVGEDVVIRLNKIEIDIGNINSEIDFNNNSEIINRILRLLEEAINKELKKSSSGRNVLRFGPKPSFRSLSDPNDEHFREGEQNFDNSFFKNKYSKGNKSTNQNSVSENSTVTLVRVHYFNAWLYWLEKGTLPPYATQPEENWITLVLETLVLDHHAIHQLEKKLKQYPIVLERLVLQHNTKDLKSIVELYTGFSQVGLLDFFKELKQLFSDELQGYLPTDNVSFFKDLKHNYSDPVLKPNSKSISYRELEIKTWKLIFIQVISKRRTLSSDALIHEIFSLPDFNTVRNKISEIIRKGPKAKYIFLHKIIKETAQSQEKKHVSESKTEAATDALEDDIIKVKVSLEELQIESPQFFKNAGIVLIHPFLSNFFKNLNLLEGHEFKDFNSQSKAVLLLHFLATDEVNPPEYDMVLPKFLCEMPANMPMDHTLLLTDEEKEEANNVLQAAITHWGALGTTSTEGLQEGFLRREGKLIKEQTGWKLYVEQKTLDILIDRLPWTLSMIKLPWMKEILKVEWR